MENEDIKGIDIDFDFSTETSGEKPDIDRDSTTLRKYHKLLWKKKLPNGEYPIFRETDWNGLEIKTATYKTILSSDTMINTYTGNWIKDEIDLNYLKTIEEIDKFLGITSKIGNYIMYPKTRINWKDSFNQDRGKNSKIYDRFDLSLECIKRYYNDEDSPLRETIQRYNQFFKLFKDFKGYCDFYLLQDLTKNDYKEINYLMPFEGFEENPIPKNANEYRIYMNNATEFINKRIRRIQGYINSCS
jgi:hypothetical protein